jgi:hypothetical protein
MNTQERELVRFLRLLDGLGCLEHVMLIGSWAELLYERAGLLEGFEPSIKTMDIDFLVRNMRRPVPEVQVAAEARGHGYLVESDRITDVTKLYSIEGLEIEFLIGKVGAGLEASLRTNLGVTAQSLRHMEVLARHMVTVPYEGMAVNIPAPEAYAVHKMVVNKERGKKQEKDAQAILRMWPFLDTGVLGEVIAGLTRKERSRVTSFLEAHGLRIS